MQECHSAPDDVLQTAETSKPWPEGSCCPAVLLLCLCPVQEPAARPAGSSKLASEQ